MSTSNSQDIIGVAGSFSSGKDTLSHYLERQHGYRHPSTSDIVRKYAMEQRGSIERPILFEVANELRHKRGAGVFVEEALQGSRPVVVSGIRSLGEAKAIKNAGGTLVFVDAPAEIRYERMKSRLRDNETQLTFEEFVANEQKEWHSGDSDADFNLRDIKNIADINLSNGEDLESFLKDAKSQLGLY